MPFRTTLLCFVPAFLLLLAGISGWPSEDDEPLILENHLLLIEIDRATGNFLRITSPASGRDLVRMPADQAEGPAWEIKFAKGGPAGGSLPLTDSPPHTYMGGSSEHPRLHVNWQGEEDIEVEATLFFDPDSDYLKIESKIINGGQGAIKSFRYPVLYGVRPPGDDPEKTFFSAPYMIGRLYRDPFDLLDSKSKVFRYRYPGGNKLAMQFLSLYEENRGGLYLATHDPHHTVKEFHFEMRDGLPLFSVTQKNWDIRPGLGLNLDYPFVLAALTEGAWQEAADIYKKWAIRQTWAQNPLSKRRKEIGWFFDHVGFTVFGISSKVDQRPWYQAFHDILKGTGARVLFVPSWDWNRDWALGNNVVMRDFSADFNRNLELIRRNGDYVAPFYFDLKIRTAHPWWDEEVEGVPGSPWKAHTIQPETGQQRQQNWESWQYMCPTQRPFIDLHIWRDKRLVGDYALDGVYQDISVGIAPTGCHNPLHRHPPGEGRWLIQAYRDLIAQSRQAASEARGKPIILGTEEITENYLDLIDFNHLGGGHGTGPIRRETDRDDALIQSGRCVEIPLFPYVYHEYGTVRNAGRMQISTECGGAWYYITGQEYLWGGLVELNYFRTPLELFPGTKPPTYQSGFGISRWEDDPYVADPKKITFLRECADLRTGVGREFLVYGTMLRQPPVRGEIKTLHLPFRFWYRRATSKAFQREIEAFPSPELLREAWRSPDGRLGMFFVNLNAEKNLEVRLPVEKLAALYNMGPKTRLLLGFPEHAPGFVVEKTGDSWLLHLPPRTPVFLEAVSAFSGDN